MYLKLKALCSLTKCFIVIGLIRFLLSSWRCYHRLEAVVGNQSSRAQTLSRWDQLTVIWFQNTLPEEAPGREWPPRYEPGAGGLCSCSVQPSSPASPPVPLPPSSSPRVLRRCWDMCLFKENLLFLKFHLLPNSKYFFLVPTGLCCPIH